MALAQGDECGAILEASIVRRLRLQLRLRIAVGRSLRPFARRTTRTRKPPYRVAQSRENVVEAKEKGTRTTNVRMPMSIDFRTQPAIRATTNRQRIAERSGSCYGSRM